MQGTYETDVAGRDEDGRAGDTDEAELPVEDEAEDGADGERRDTLHDRAERDASEAVDLLRVVAERRRELAGVVLVLVEELDVLAEDRAEGERAQLGRELRGRGREEVVLEADGDHGQDRDDEEV